MNSRIDQQQFFDARSVLEQQQIVPNYLYELHDLVKKGQNTTEIWQKIFDHATMKTKLTTDEQQKLHQVFVSIMKSPLRKDHIEDFMAQLKKSTLKRPRITKYFLRQLFPLESFSGSIHKYSNLPILQNVVDYLRYLIAGPPSKKFQQQMARYVYTFPPSSPLPLSKKTLSIPTRSSSQEQSLNSMSDYLDLYVSLRQMDNEKRKKIFKKTQKLLTEKIKKALLSEKQNANSEKQKLLLNNLSFIFRVLEEGVDDRPSSIRVHLKPMSSTIYSIFQLLGWPTTNISNFFQKQTKTKSKNLSSL